MELPPLGNCGPELGERDSDAAAAAAVGAEGRQWAAGCKLVLGDSSKPSGLILHLHLTHASHGNSASVPRVVLASAATACCCRHMQR